VNLHHVVLDGAIWRLRDARVAATLTGTQAPAPGTAWMRVPKPALGWELAAALLAVAAVGAIQQYLTLDGGGAGRLDLAQRLNPHDSRVAVRRAEILARAQRLDDARRVLAGSLEPQLANAAALRLYGGLLVASGRYDEAAAHYRVVEDSVGLDAEGLVNTAVLAMRDGDLDTAAANLRAALQFDPGLPSAHLNLAGVCLEQDDQACALAHNEAYLTSPAVARDRAYAAAALNAASAAVLAEQPRLALGLLDATARLAGEIDAPDLVALADRQAAALREQGRSAER
jgi:tetratricopeptide (TPR) repeat protein